MSELDYDSTVLGEVLNLQYGSSLPEKARVPGQFPVYGSNGQIGTHHDFLIEGPGIIVGRKGSAGSVTWSDEAFWAIDTTYYVEPKNGHVLKWIYYLLDYLKLERLSLTSGVPGLNRNEAYNLVVKVPHYPEQQRKIAAILSSLDDAIEKTQAVIDQLKVIKRGLMQQLFTRGLVSSTRQTPKQALNVIGKWGGGGTPSKSKRMYWEDGTIPWISPKDMHSDRVYTAEDYITEKAILESSAKTYLPKAILFVTRSGILRKRLPVSITEREVAVNQDLRVLVVNENHDPDYIFYCVKANAENIRLQCAKAGTTVESIVSKHLERFKIPTPSKDEQVAIASIFISTDQRIEAEQTKKSQLAVLKKGLMQGLLSGRMGVG